MCIRDSFTADLASLQVDFAPTPSVSLRTITQYNSQSEQLSTSARIRYIFRPGSDIYFVYDDVRRDDVIPMSPWLDEYRDRQFLIKMTYLMSF